MTLKEVLKRAELLVNLEGKGDVLARIDIELFDSETGQRTYYDVGYEDYNTQTNNLKRKNTKNTKK
jgi:hypothetical protein